MTEKFHYLLGTTDAREWAQAFCQVCPDADEGLMITWFANAIETGAMRKQRQLGDDDKLPRDTDFVVFPRDTFFQWLGGVALPHEVIEDWIGDAESVIHQHCGSDGSSDEHNDWVHDLANELWRHLGRGNQDCAPVATSLIEWVEAHDLSGVVIGAGR